MTKIHARTRTAALAALAVATPALIALGASAGQAAVTGSGTVSVNYTCTNNHTTDVASMPMDLTVQATPSGTQTKLTIAGGSTTMDDTITLDSISGTLKATVGGAETKLSGSATKLAIKKGVAFTLPSLTGTVNTPGTTTTFTPGLFTLSIKTTYLFVPVEVILSCTAQGTPATITLGTPAVTPPVTPTVNPTVTPGPTQAPVPRPARAPKMKVALTGKVVKTRAKGPRVTVSVTRATSAYSHPTGTVKVKVGSRTVAKMKVARGKKVSVRLPKQSKAGTKKVTVSYAPDAAARTAGHLKASKKVTYKVRRH